METFKKLEQWILKMGYQDGIPPSSILQRICNPSTAIIWEQLINKTRSKQEVENIRNNILIKQLLKSDLPTFPHISMFHQEYSDKEIVAWNKIRALKQKIHATQNRIHELKSTATNTHKHNKIKYVNLEYLNDKIRKLHRLKFLLISKANDLEIQVNDIKEMLDMVSYLTPIEGTDQDDERILNTLTMCSEKLYKLIEQQRSLSTNGNVTMSLLQDSLISTIYSEQVFNESGLSDDSMSFTGVVASSFLSATPFSNYELAILNDEVLSKILADLLHNNDRRTIWETIQKLNETYQHQLKSSVIQNYKVDPSNIKKNKHIKLYAIHVEYELKARKCVCEIKSLKKEMDQLYEIGRNLAYSQSQLQQYLKKIKLDVISQQIEEIIMQPTHSIKNDLRTTTEKEHALHNNTECVLNAIKHKMSVFKESLYSTSQSRNRISVSIRQLLPFTLDLNWTMGLCSNANSMEIQAFLDFPLEYNRIVCQSDINEYPSNISMNWILYPPNLDSNYIHMLLAILRSPVQPVETILVDVIKRMLKMSRLEELQKDLKIFHNFIYSEDILHKQEQHLNSTLNSLKNLLSLQSTRKVGSTLSRIKSTHKFWLETPISNIVLTDKLIDGKPYEYYCKLFESYFHQL